MRIFLLAVVLLISGCSIEVGKFTPKRHALHDQNRPDCEENPDRCVDGYPW